MTRTAANNAARDDATDTDETGHGTDTVEVNLGQCRYGSADADEAATKMAVRKDGTGWIAVCDDHVREAEEAGFEIRDETG